MESDSFFISSEDFFQDETRLNSELNSVHTILKKVQIISNQMCPEKTLL